MDMLQIASDLQIIYEWTQGKASRRDAVHALLDLIGIGVDQIPEQSSMAKAGACPDADVPKALQAHMEEAKAGSINWTSLIALLLQILQGFGR